MLSWGKLRREPATRWFDESFAPIPKFDDRFARQNRYEPPPEFPLASPYSGIDHHLSGPNKYALTQIFQRISRSVDDAPLQVLTSANHCSPSLSFRPRACKPKDLRMCQTPWSVFQDGSIEAISPASEGTSPASSSVRAAVRLPRCNTRQVGLPS